MLQKYMGTFEELEGIVYATGILGKWQEDKTGKHTFRSVRGGVLDWWPSTGTIRYQGEDDAKIVLELSFEKVLAGKKCNMKPISTAAERGADRLLTSSPQINRLARLDNVDATSLKRIKKALLRSGLTIMTINNSPFIVNKAETNQH